MRVDDDAPEFAVFADDDALSDNAFLDVRPRQDQAVPRKDGTPDAGAEHPAPLSGENAVDMARVTSRGVGVGWRVRVGDGPYGPLRIVERHLRVDVQKVHVGFPVGFDGPDVAPVGLVQSPVGVSRSGEVVGREIVREDAASGHEIREDVLAEVVR